MAKKGSGRNKAKAEKKNGPLTRNAGVRKGCAEKEKSPPAQEEPWTPWPAPNATNNNAWDPKDYAPPVEDETVQPRVRRDSDEFLMVDGISYRIVDHKDISQFDLNFRNKIVDDRILVQHKGEWVVLGTTSKEAAKQAEVRMIRDKEARKEKLRLARNGMRGARHLQRDHNYVFRPRHVCDMVSALAELETSQPWIGMDMEASNLGHTSDLAILQIRDYLNGQTYIVDLLVLQEKAWITTGTDGHTTLRTILTDPNRVKLIWDCRSDACCLYAQADLKLRGVLDVQLLHMLLMQPRPHVRYNLAKGVRDIVSTRIPEAEWDAWLANKNGLKGHGGAWDVRPLTPIAIKYAIADMVYLRDMYEVAHDRMTTHGMDSAMQWSKMEVEGTWVTAEEWKDKNTRYYVREDARGFWTKPLLKFGVDPIPGPQITESVAF